MRRLYFGVAALALTTGAGAAHAQDDDQRWYVHAGPAQLTLADEATIRVNGVEIPGASYASDPQVTSVVEIGRELNENWAVSVTLGLPPEAEARGSGSIAGIGMLGSATYGPSAVTAHYHLELPGGLEPYVGAGFSYMVIFDTSDGVMNGLDIDDTFGPVLQAGVEYEINERWGVFVDVKKAWLESEATGTLGGLPVSADMTFDPVVVNAGLSFRF